MASEAGDGVGSTRSGAGPFRPVRKAFDGYTEDFADFGEDLTGQQESYARVRGYLPEATSGVDHHSDWQSRASHNTRIHQMRKETQGDTDSEFTDNPRSAYRAPWSSRLLHLGLRPATPPEEVTPPNVRWGWPQVFLIVAGVLVWGIVLLSNVTSKISYIALAEAARSGRNAEHGSVEWEKGHVAIAMIILCVMIPQGLNFLIALWNYLQRAKRNNPRPSILAMLWTLLSVTLEVGGVVLLALVVSIRVPGAMSLIMSIGIFSFSGLRQALNDCSSNANSDAYRNGLSERSPLINSHGSHKKSVPHTPLIFRKSLNFTRFLDSASAFVQIGAMVFVPFYVHHMGGDILCVVLSAVSMLCLSICWLPSIQERMVVTSDPLASFSARVQTSLLAATLRVGLTSFALWVIMKLDGSTLDMGLLKHAFRILDKYETLLVPFIMQLVSSFIGYHMARMACKMDMQFTGFALPLNLATPLTILIVSTGCSHLPFHLDIACFPKNEIVGMLIICTFVWLSEIVITARTAWNPRIPRLALDETLFYQPTYCGIMLESFTLINRRIPDEASTEPQLSATEELARSRVYVCTTMYHEDANEMRQLLRSVLRLDAELGGKVCEEHIFMDGGIVNNTLGSYALQLIHCLAAEIKALDIGLDEDWLKNGQRIRTPYGERLEWTLPIGKMPLVIHLKDGLKVKKKKRWSQCLYMFYLLQFRCSPEYTSPDVASYILTTDADVKFEPKDVIALLMLLARDKRVGAVCGRTYPMGSGPLVWYQIFDYAVGHWFQKTAEHVLGSVMCCPGCFSLYRIEALRDVVMKYASSVTEAVDFLTKDMGEDRWLCTLLVLAGWRLDYTAASTDSTYCPDNFDEFFNQRRRWVPSTLANIVELLKNWREATTMNDSVSIFFILYQALMLFSAVVSPATVLLVIIGGVQVSMNGSLSVINGAFLSITCIFIAVCLYTPQKFQLLMAKILTVAFALVMGAVTIGIAAEIAEEIAKAHHHTTTTPAPWTTTKPHNHSNFSYYDDSYNTFSVLTDLGTDLLGSTDLPGGVSISTVYLATIASLFVIAGLMHFTEFYCLVHGVWYLLCLPGGYLFLLIYSVCNLDDRSWGTRMAYIAEEGGGRPDEFSTSIWDGCGMYRGESMSHFIGRVLCCRVNVRPQEKAPENPYSLISSFSEKSLKTEPQWSLTEDASKADCKAVTALLNYLSKGFAAEGRSESAVQPLEVSELTELTRKALVACPNMGARGQWTTYWDDAKKKFRQPRNGASVTDPTFLSMMHGEVVAFMDQEYSWRVVERDDVEEPHSGEEIMKTPVWLNQSGVRSPSIQRILLENGYEDTTFLVSLTEQDLIDMGITQTIDGRALCRKLLIAVKKLPKNHVPNNIPVNLVEWLTLLRLKRYQANFIRFGYNINDLHLIEGLTKNDLKMLGVVKKAHQDKFMAAIKKLTSLLNLGHSPEDTSKASRADIIARDIVARLPIVPLDESILVERHVVNDEEAFWNNTVEEHLDPKLDPIDNLTNLKDKLRSLRNVAVMCLFVINALWLVLMEELNNASSTRLSLLGTNPLGLLFLFLYGGLFVIQFLTLIVHRGSTAMQVLSSTPFLKRDIEPPPRPSATHRGEGQASKHNFFA